MPQEKDRDGMQQEGQDDPREDPLVAISIVVIEQAVPAFGVRRALVSFRAIKE
jgi:hypothetical protein